MNEPVDKMLTSRIRQVFEDFEDPSADAGWKELRKKYPESNRRPVMLWLSSAAALFILAAGLWFANQSEQLLSMKPVKKEQPVAERGKPAVADTMSAGTIEIAENNTSSEFDDARVASVVPVRKPATPAVSEDSTAEAEGMVIAQVLQEAEQLVPDEEVVAARRSSDIQASRTASLVVKDRPGFPVVPIDPVKKQESLKEFNPVARAQEEKNKDADQKSKKPALSVFAGSYFNYSEGSESHLNFGAGFLSDIRLSKNLKLSTGISIASNSLNYEKGQNLPSEAYRSFYSAAQPASGNLTTITSYNASLLTLDIPVNIKYQFLPESDKFYLSAGLSSGTYLNETYGYEYRNFSTATGNYASPTKDQKIKKQLNDFDLGRTFNLSLGLSTGFGKTQVVSIEPFLKYPLGGLGSENLRFGSAGINLRLRFAPPKN